MADLVTLAAVKTFLSIATTNQDTLIAQLIPRESRLIEQYTSRQFPAVTNTAKRLNGTGTSMLMLPDTPILSIALLQINGVAIPASADGLQTGYIFDDTTIHLVGNKFPMGRLNVTCSWSAGYQTSETGFIPAGTTHTIEPTTNGTAAVDLGVTNATTGAALALVGSAPATGQYSFAAGVYTFAAADAGVRVTMAYQYIPGPVVQGCIEMVGIDLKSRDNMGIRSKSLAGETITYTDTGITSSVRELLGPYRKVAPA